MNVKIGKVADQFGISAQTIRNWVKDERFADFFSAEAKSDADKHGEFTESDMLVVNTIRELSKGRKHNFDEIAAKLKAGQRESMLPDRAAVVAVTTTPALALALRAGSAEDRLKYALEVLAETQARLFQIEHDKNEEIKDLLREIADLREEIGALKRETDLYASGRLKASTDDREGQ